VEKVNIACVFWGNAYPLEYVGNLSRAVRRYLTVPYQFNIFTNRRDEKETLEQWGNVVYLPDVSYQRPWWHKLWLFSAESGLSGTVLYFDLDLVITAPVRKFIATSNQLHIIHDFTRLWSPNTNKSNSSIMSWVHDEHQYMWNEFNKQQTQAIRSFHGDQDFINAYAKSKKWYPSSWAVSYRWEYLKMKSVHQDTAAVIFHGSPKPHQTTDSDLYFKWSLPA
jgi:hypothetical protein